MRFSIIAATVAIASVMAAPLPQAETVTAPVAAGQVALAGTASTIDKAGSTTTGTTLLPNQAATIPIREAGAIIGNAIPLKRAVPGETLPGQVAAIGTVQLAQALTRLRNGSN